MKALSILYFLLVLSFISFSQKITHGPDIGEIYFIGPNYDGEGLYHSSDFGETATFVDNSYHFISIAADKTEGGIYCTTLPVSLYYSDNYGNSNSWEFKFYNDYLSSIIMSGVEAGHVFSDCYMHSEDYGSSFNFHSLQGWFGSAKTTAMDNLYGNICYAISYKLSQSDSLYLFKTYDKFENVNLVQQWNLNWNNNIHLSSGALSGDLYLMNFTQNSLMYSSDYAESFTPIDTFNFSDDYNVGMIGGRQEGEVYLLYSFVKWMWNVAHVYIFHSTDYGKTFEVFHPFAKGNQPVLANFSSDITEGEMPFTVDFCNFSIGEIQQYEWDFENDGIIDSWEQSPTHTYNDTGYYSVSLKITGPDSSNTFVKENYIHVHHTTGLNEIEQSTFDCYPNPFNDQITIDFSKSKIPETIKIFDINGKLVKRLDKPKSKKQIVWDGRDDLGRKCKSGIYYITTNSKAQSQKIILID